MQCLYRIGHRLKDNSKVEEGKGLPNCAFIDLHIRETDIGNSWFSKVDNKKQIFEIYLAPRTKLKPKLNIYFG